MMTCKTYNTIAACINAERETVGGGPTSLVIARCPSGRTNVGVVYSLMNRIAVEMKMDNPNFDRDRFEVACGFLVKL
jgi:hypothetical protein